MLPRMKIKIENGIVKIDEISIDRNTFFLNAGKELTCPINLCCWNINGVRNKFKAPNVKMFFQ